MQKLIQPTVVMRKDGKRTNTIYTLLAIIVALAMFLAASGSGNPTTAEPLPAWFDTSANVLAALIGILVLLPKTRVASSMAAAVLMLLSMFFNYTVDGYAFFLRALPFNLGTLVIALVLIRHYWDDLSSYAPGKKR
ncbi:MAG: hypothetical protein R3E79_26795 [Caldilineaceae bacterium]